VQALPSLQEAPSVFGTAVQRPETTSQIPWSWQGVGGGQTTGCPWQTPSWQASSVVQGFRSLQGVPSGATGSEQVPVAGLQTPGRWQASVAGHGRGLEPVQTPAWQESTRVQGFPSSQGAPLGFTGRVHSPVAG
jgi:hypothetical protein